MKLTNIHDSTRTTHGEITALQYRWPEVLKRGTWLVMVCIGEHSVLYPAVIDEFGNLIEVSR